MELSWRVLCLSFGLGIIQLCNGLPMELLSSNDGRNAQLIGVLVAVMVSVCAVVAIIGCMCCQRRRGFKEFRDSPVAASVVNDSTLTGDDPGHVNPIVSTEFTIFTPLSPPHHNNNVFRSHQPVISYIQNENAPEQANKIVNANFDGIDVSSWFESSQNDFPRSKLKYIRELGSGWFGRVVEGEAQGIKDDQQAGWTPVAVRILESSAPAHDQAMFLHEANMYRIQEPHPHVLRLLGRSLEATPLLLIQEYCPKGDLKKFLLENRLYSNSPAMTKLPLQFCCQLASALQYLHDNNMPHLDLAARTCQITTDLSIRLGDYGLAVNQYPNDYYQGTPAIPVRWCAPETLNYTSTTLQPKQVTCEGNIWSLGVVMWEICEWGTQPYDWLTDDEVVSQVMGTPHVRLPQPALSVHYVQPLYRLMQLCWQDAESRPLISQIYSMLLHLLETYQRDNASKSPSKVPEFAMKDFDSRWEAFKPNTIVKTDNHLTSEAELTVPAEKITDISSISSVGDVFPNLHTEKSPSMTNLHGSFENLVDGETEIPVQNMDSWLQNVATHTGDMQYVRGLSQAIQELDSALALEQTSSSGSSFEQSPAPEQWDSSEALLGKTDADPLHKIEFKLGLTDQTNLVSKLNMTDSSNLTDSLLFGRRSESGSETEDETWKKRIERGAYSEKVRQKSKSVADLMVLTHIECSDTDSETPQQSLEYRVNYKNVRFAPRLSLEGASMMYGSEGNLLTVQDTFQEELRKLQEERRDSLLFVPGRHSSDSELNTSANIEIRVSDESKCDIESPVKSQANLVDLNNVNVQEPFELRSNFAKITADDFDQFNDNIKTTPETLFIEPREENVTEEVQNTHNETKVHERLVSDEIKSDSRKLEKVNSDDKVQEENMLPNTSEQESDLIYSTNVKSNIEKEVDETVNKITEVQSSSSIKDVLDNKVEEKPEAHSNRSEIENTKQSEIVLETQKELTKDIFDNKLSSEITNQHKEADAFSLTPEKIEESLHKSEEVEISNLLAKETTEDETKELHLNETNTIQTQVSTITTEYAKDSNLLPVNIINTESDISACDEINKHMKTNDLFVGSNTEVKNVNALFINQEILHSETQLADEHSVKNNSNENQALYSTENLEETKANVALLVNELIEEATEKIWRQEEAKRNVELSSQLRKDTDTLVDKEEVEVVNLNNSNEQKQVIVDELDEKTTSEPLSQTEYKQEVSVKGESETDISNDNQEKEIIFLETENAQGKLPENKQEEKTTVEPLNKTESETKEPTDQQKELLVGDVCAKVTKEPKTETESKIEVSAEVLNKTNLENEPQEKVETTTEQKNLHELVEKATDVPINQTVTFTIVKDDGNKNSTVEEVAVIVDNVSEQKQIPVNELEENIEKSTISEIESKSEISAEVQKDFEIPKDNQREEILTLDNENERNTEAKLIENISYVREEKIEKEATKWEEKDENIEDLEHASKEAHIEDKILPESVIQSNENKKQDLELSTTLVETPKSESETLPLEDTPKLIDALSTENISPNVKQEEVALISAQTVIPEETQTKNDAEILKEKKVIDELIIQQDDTIQSESNPGTPESMPELIYDINSFEFTAESTKQETNLAESVDDLTMQIVDEDKYSESDILNALQSDNELTTMKTEIKSTENDNSVVQTTIEHKELLSNNRKDEYSLIQNFINNERIINDINSKLITTRTAAETNILPKEETDLQKETDISNANVETATTTQITTNLLDLDALNDSSTVQPINQVYNVFNVTIDHKPPLECFTSPVKNFYNRPFNQTEIITDISGLLLESDLMKIESKSPEKLLSVCTSSLPNDHLLNVLNKPPLVNGIRNEIDMNDKLTEISFEISKPVEEIKITENVHDTIKLNSPRKLSDIVLDSLKDSSTYGENSKFDMSDILQVEEIVKYENDSSNIKLNLTEKEENLNHTDDSSNPEKYVITSTPFVKKSVPKKNDTNNLNTDNFFSFVSEGDEANDFQNSVILGPCEDYSLPFYSGLKTTFGKYSEDDRPEEELLQFSSNFMPLENDSKNVNTTVGLQNKKFSDSGNSSVDYSLETWDRFLGKSFHDQENCQNSVFENMSPMHADGSSEEKKHSEDKEVDKTCTVMVTNQNFDQTFNINEKTLNKTATQENDKTFNLNKTYNQNTTFVKEPMEGENKTFILDKTEIKENAEEVEEEPVVSNSWEPGEGWFLHPQISPEDMTGQIDTSGSDNIDNSYVGFTLDEECVNALRNELAAKLPHAQGLTHDEEQQEPNDWDTEERSEVIVKYNVYATPLSPIPEESFCEDAYCDQTQNREETDSDSDWSEPGLGRTSQLEDILVVDTETHTALILESPSLREPQHRHTPSQDSCCSNDTLFNLEDLNYGPLDHDHSPLHHGLVTTVRPTGSESTDQEEILQVEVTPRGTPNHSISKEEEVETTPRVEEPEVTANSDNSAEVNLTYTKPDININVLDSDILEDKQNSLQNSSAVNSELTEEKVNDVNSTESSNKLELKLDPSAFGVAPLPSPEDIPWRQLPASLLTYNEVVQNDKFEIQQEAENIPETEVEKTTQTEELNLVQETVKLDEELSDRECTLDTDLYSNLTDIRFSGPCDTQLMSTSFSESAEFAEERDWDSGSDTRSSSSGEFIWKEGEHEESLRALHAASHDVGVTEDINPMDAIQEENSNSSNDDSDDDCEEDIEETEFVPSAWDSQATPTKSALRSPEKSTKRKNQQQKGVWFKKQKYHCVYEYPREPESPVAPSSDLWRPVSDFSNFADWELDPESCIPPYDDQASTECRDGGYETVLDKYISRSNYPLASGSALHRDLYQLNPFPEFYTGIPSSDEDFFISSSAKPFQTLGQGSQFFPGQDTAKSKLLWQDYQSSSLSSSRDLSDTVTPDSGVEDVTPASLSDNLQQPPLQLAPPKNKVQTLKCLAALAANKSTTNEIKSQDSLGGLRHTRNRLKLDLPPSPNSFTSNRTFTIDVTNDPVINREIPAFTTFGKSRFSVQHVQTPTEDSDDFSLGKARVKNVSFEALPHKPMKVNTSSVYILDKPEDSGKHKPVEIVQGEASLLDSADEDSGIESSANATLERHQQQILN